MALKAPSDAKAWQVADLAAGAVSAEVSRARLVRIGRVSHSLLLAWGRYSQDATLLHEAAFYAAQPWFDSHPHAHEEQLALAADVARAILIAANAVVARDAETPGGE